MNTSIFRIYPHADYFEISSVFFPYIDVFADDRESAKRAVEILCPTQTIAFVKLVSVHGNNKSLPHI